MRLIRSAVLYTALALGANPAAAADPAALEALKAGDMKKLVVASAPSEPRDAVLLDAADAEVPLSDYRGKVVLLNFWATWCAPCRAEMPSLDRLQAELGGPDFDVVTIATGRNPVPAIEKFFAETGIERLPVLRDPKQSFARDMAVMGLPVTVILDREGREVARLIGDAHWDTPEAIAILREIIGPAG